MSSFVIYALNIHSSVITEMRYNNELLLKFNLLTQTKHNLRN